MGYIYRHSHMDLNEFSDYCINNLLDKLSKETKTVFLLGDFNIDLTLTNEFLDSLSSHMLLPHIVQPTRIRNNSKTLIDNTYSNVITPNNISTLLPQYQTISPNFLLLLILSITHHLQNWIFLKETGPGLINKILFLTVYL